MTSPLSSGELRQLSLSDLLLDWSNPRLPPEMQGESHSQLELAVYINKHYDPLRIAESIARHEYFQSEPLIAVQSGTKFRVIEGNRRLTALRGLAESDLRARFAAENKGWSRLPEAVLPATFPVVVVDDESSIAPLLGFRHISGIEPWDPHAQARYIARLVNEERQTLDAVAELVGRTSSEVKAMYRDFDILQQAEATFGLDVSRARSAFGVFTNAMARRSIQKYIGAKPPRYTDPIFFPLPDTRKPQVARLLVWVFGGPKGEGRVIADSRQLGELAKVLAHSRATEVLEASGSLSDATDAMADVAEQFTILTARVGRDLAKIADLNPAEITADDWEVFAHHVQEQLTIAAERRKGARS